MDLEAMLLHATGYTKAPKSVERGTYGDFFPIRESEVEFEETTNPDTKAREKGIWGATRMPRYGKYERETARGDRVFIEKDLPKAGKNFRKYVKQHEQDHVLAGRNTGGSDHPLYDYDTVAAEHLRRDLERAIAKNREEILQKYPEFSQSGYIKKAGVPGYVTDLSEVMADLNAIQEMYGVDITKDPAFFDAFKSTRNRELFNASTGVRRTRLDARDPIPYDPRGYR